MAHHTPLGLDIPSMNTTPGVSDLTPTAPTSKRKATRYVSSACDFCKQRHLRCDGQEICFQCQKRQQTCTYTQKNIKRGPKPKNKRNKKDANGNPYLSPTQTAGMTMVTKFPLAENIKTDPFYSNPSPDTQRKNVPMKGDITDMRTAASAYLLPSVEVTTYLLTAFVEKVSPFCPHNMRLSPQLACELWKHMPVTIELRKLDLLVECFSYAVVLAYGSRVTNNEPLAIDFIGKADEILNFLFFSSLQISPETFSTCADTLVSTLLMLAVLKLESYDFNGSRICIVQAYNILNMHIGEVTPQVSHRLFAHMAGISRSTKDMTHWVNSSHALGVGASTPINRVMLSLLYCSPSMLRDPKNKPLATELFVPPSQNLLHPNDLALYQKMLTEFDDTDDLVWETEQRNKQQQLETSPDYLFTFKLITEGCRSLVLAQCGFPEQALGCADKCIQYCKILQNRISFWAIPLALAYATQVCATLNNLPLFQDGLSLFEFFPAYFMFVPPIYHTLTFRVIPFVQHLQSHDQNPSEQQPQSQQPSTQHLDPNLTNDTTQLQSPTQPSSTTQPQHMIQNPHNYEQFFPVHNEESGISHYQEIDRSIPHPLGHGSDIDHSFVQFVPTHDTVGIVDIPDHAVTSSQDQERLLQQLNMNEPCALESDHTESDGKMEPHVKQETD